MRVSIVSLKVSPLERELFSKLTLITLCPNFFEANSKLIVVLVDASKNKLNIFLGLLVFFWFVDFLNLRALLTIEEISFKDRSSTEVIFQDTTMGVFIQTQEIIKY